MSRRTFWIGVLLAVGAVVVLPALLVGLLAIGNGLATGNARLALAGTISTSGALVVGALLWWLGRRHRASGSAARAD